MPYSSSALTSEASEKRGGGSVKCCSPCKPMSLTRSPSCMAGSTWSFSSSPPASSRPSWYTAMKPGFTSVEPLARSMWPEPRVPAMRSTATVSNTAWAIWQAMARFQISA